MRVRERNERKWVRKEGKRTKELCMTGGRVAPDEANPSPTNSAPSVTGIKLERICIYLALASMFDDTS